MNPDAEFMGRMGHPLMARTVALPSLLQQHFTLALGRQHRYQEDNPGHLLLPRSPQPVSKENSFKLGFVLVGFFLPAPTTKGLCTPMVTSPPRCTGTAERHLGKSESACWKAARLQVKADLG